MYSFKDGAEAPETTRQSFPSLTLEQVYGAIAFYLGHQADVDANIREGEEELERSVPPLSESRPDLYGRILVSHDKRTMPARLTQFVARGGSSPSVLLVIPQHAPVRVVAGDPDPHLGGRSARRMGESGDKDSVPMRRGHVQVADVTFNILCIIVYTIRQQSMPPTTSSSSVVEDFKKLRRERRTEEVTMLVLDANILIRGAIPRPLHKLKHAVPLLEGAQQLVKAIWRGRERNVDGPVFSANLDAAQQRRQAGLALVGRRR